MNILPYVAIINISLFEIEHGLFETKFKNGGIGKQLQTGKHQKLTHGHLTFINHGPMLIRETMSTLQKQSKNFSQPGLILFYRLFYQLEKSRRYAV